MNDKTREQIEAMKNQTIGVEIEMNNITREKAARKVAEYFGTRAWNAACEYGYSSWACKDQQGRVWKFQKDVSIYGPDAEKCELVTPILTYEDIEPLQEIIRLLRKAGAKSSPSRGCGVHIHIGKGDHTAKTLRNLVNIMAAHERQIGRAIRIDAGRTGHYCQVVNHRFLDRLNYEKPTTMRKLEDIWYEGKPLLWKMPRIWLPTRFGWTRKPAGSRWLTTRNSSTIPSWISWNRTQSDVHSVRYSGQKIVYYSRLLSSAPDGNMHIPKGKSPTENKTHGGYHHEKEFD